MRPKSLQHYLRFACLLCFFPALQAQTLNKPTPAPNPNINASDPWPFICARESFNEFYVNFTWLPPLVNTDNSFILELSDANGDFSNPVELNRISDKNTDIDFDIQFTLPQNIQGDGYRLRVRSTSPALTSEVSDPYAMYFTGFTNPIFISEDGNGTIPPGGTIQTCGGSPITLAAHNVPNPENYTYLWERSGTILSETSHEITVDQPGMYFVQIDYGDSCSGSANTFSNFIEVTTGTTQGIAINTPDQTTLCPDDTVTLEADSSNTGYLYTWYKDGSIVSGPTLNASTLTVSGATLGFEGAYSVSISGTGICTETSDSVTLTTPGTFSVTRENDARLVLLPGANETLSISTNASNPSIQWYRNDVAIDGATSSTLTVTEIGQYHAAVTETGGDCGATTKIPETTTLVQPDSFEIIIAFNGSYEACANSSTVLEVSQISAVENGNSFDVTDQLRDNFEYQWKKDGLPITNSTNPSISIASSSENGTYDLSATLNAVDINSNSLDVVLNSGETITITSTGTQLCDGVTITLSTTVNLSDQTFVWTRNGQTIDSTSATVDATETGTYQLAVTSDGCPILSNEITVVPFDESVITVDAEETIIFPEGSSQTITASGGTSYQWFDVQNNLISSSSSVTLENEGDYLLLASVDNCQISRTLTVEYRDNFQIPNVITANGDGINDLWVIPNTYSGQSDVTVIIYNELGDELLNQNEYANNWPPSSLVFNNRNQLFYYKIRRSNETLKQGTITVIR